MANQQNNNPGNFANDRDKAREAGKRGGQNSRSGGRRSE
jgi:general stress protein YciG